MATTKARSILPALLMVSTLILWALATPARAELPWQFAEHTRYMALGDSLAAGYGAVPATQGYVYLLYQQHVFDTAPNTLLTNSGVIGATSEHVLEFQVPQACEAFQPTVVTISVGGNDLLAISGDPTPVLTAFANNFTGILLTLRGCLAENVPIYAANLYNPFPDNPLAESLIQAINGIIADVALAFAVPVADVYGAFAGRTGLLLVERHGADLLEVHPTNAGHRAIAEAFEAVIAAP